MADTRAYNPLSIDELGRNAARAIRRWPAVELPPDELTEGAGVYALYYSGPFTAYADMGADEPIYVGQAVHTKTKPRPLRQRIGEHAQSIESAENLDLQDFRCRWVVLDPVWIGMTERILIDQYRPIWNDALKGFGIHAPGSGRGGQMRSLWDTLHPGRRMAATLPPRKESASEIMVLIATHRETDQ